MTVQIQLGARRDVAQDDLGRHQIGWWPGQSEQEAWECGRGVWKASADRVLEHELAEVVAPDGTVLAVGAIRGVTKVSGGRIAIEGVLQVGHPVVGRVSPRVHTSRNPVMYFGADS